ncbi:MAG TPA: VOC family protein [Methanospirillum sp.]|nr:VOC family protein [Methanospirillum sp.]
MSQFRLASFVLFVKDPAVSKKFYQDYLSQEIAMDLGVNVGFTSGLALWQEDYARNVIFGEPGEKSTGKNVEVYFEVDAIEDVFAHMKTHDIEFIHDLKEQPWSQRVFRIYDPDRFIVEIAESMPNVVQRLHTSGMEFDDIVKKTYMPPEIVSQMMA